MKLNEFIPLEKIDTSLLKYQASTRYVPTETIVYNPGIFTPEIARTFITNTWFVDNKILTRQELQEYCKKTTGGFRGTSYYEEILLVEVWRNHGDDGHITYTHDGYRLITMSQLSDDDKECKSIAGLPKSMTSYNDW